MRYLMPLLLACGGPAFVPVSVVFDSSQYAGGPPGSPIYVSASATKKLNPACAMNCELGDAFPDGGGSRSWIAASGRGDGGVVRGADQEVAVGAAVTVFVVSAGLDQAGCSASHDVSPNGLVVEAVVHTDSTCAFGFR